MSWAWSLWTTPPQRDAVARPCGVRQRETSRRRAADIERALGPGPWSRERLLEQGLTQRQLERDVAAGRLVRLRRALYAAPSQQAVDAGARAAAQVLDRFGADALLSHESAGRVRGLWLPFPADDRVHVTLPGASSRADGTVRVHGSPVAEHEVALLDGVRLTSLPRTAVDLARGRSLPQALVALDSALRIAAVGRLDGFEARLVLADPENRAATVLARERLSMAVDRESGWPGISVVRRCLPLADPRSESPYESWSRGVLVGAGAAPTSLAFPVRGASGARYVADMAWEELGVLGEVDGVTKLGSDPGTVRVRLAAERRRQRDLEDAGWLVVRWTAGESPTTIVARVRRALESRRPPHRP
jgi:hypothetical protein